MSLKFIRQPLPPAIGELEDDLWRQLADLQAQYHRAAAPILARLADLEKHRPLPTFIVTGSDLDNLPGLSELEPQ